MSPAIRRRALVFALLLTAGAAGGYWGKNAWRQAQLRELSLPELEREATRHPEEESLQIALAHRWIQAREFASAATALRNIAEQGNTEPKLWLTWAGAAAASGDPAMAAGILKLGAKNPKLAESLNAAAGRLEALSPESDPLEIAKVISPEGPVVLESYLTPSLLSGFLESQGRRDPSHAGLTTLEKLAREKPQDATVQIAWARALSANHRYPDAEPVLIALLKKDPKNFEAAIALADVRYAAGSIARAGTIYRACVKERPDNFLAVLGVARCATEKRLVYLGAEMAQKAVTLNPKSVDAWIVLGKAHFNQKLHWDRVIEAFERARQLDPTRLDYYGELYDALRLSGRFPEAEAVLNRRLAAEPNDARAHYLLANSQLDSRSDQNRKADAEKHLRRSLELYPRSATAQLRLGQLLLDQGKAEEALPYLVEASALDPYSDRAFTYAARALRRLKRDDEALKAEKIARNLGAYRMVLSPLEEARQREPSNPEIRRKLAMLYREGGEDDKAKFEEETIEMIQKYPEKAEQGLVNLMNERTLAASTEWQKPRAKKTP